MLGRYNERSIPYLARLGYLDDNFIGIHLTDATEEEAQLVAQCGASMVLCSASIGIIDGIVPPAKPFQDAGGYVALGSDQSPGNNCHNIFNEMRLTALFNKIKYGDPEVMPAWKVLRMATMEGARALGIADVTGSLEVGKAADIIMVRLEALAMLPVITTPMRNFIPNLVYAANGREVGTVIVAGRILVQNGKPLTVDLAKIRDEVQEHAVRISDEAGVKFWEINGMNARFMREGKL